MQTTLKERLREYKKNFYLNQLLKGALLGLGLFLTVFVAVSLLEYYNNFGKTARGILFFTMSGTAAYVLIQYIGKPVYGLATLDKSLSDEEAARQIGQFFPEVKDKLLNTLQLEQVGGQENSLIAASLRQRNEELKLVRFASAINFGANKKYLRYTLPPLLLLLLLFGVTPQLFTKSTTRIIRFNQDFAPKAPFDFVFANESEKAFKGEAFPINLAIEGNVVPEEAFVYISGRRHKMKPNSQGQFQFSLSNPQENFELKFEAAGFTSKGYEVPLLERPSLVSFEAKLDYPNYLNKKDRTISNVGTFTVPEGTIVTWLFKETATEKLAVQFGEEEPEAAKKAGEGLWELSKQLKSTQAYSLTLSNEHAENREAIQFTAEVIPDQHPEIEVERHADTTLYSYLILGGRISDDYGLRSLKLLYRKRDKDGQPMGKYESIGIPIQAGQASLQFFYQWDINKLKLKDGQGLDYYLMVWDNDGVNGSKSARSQVFNFRLPTKEAMEENLEASNKKTEEDIDKTLEEAKELNKNIEELQKRVQGKRKLDWQDKKMAEQLLEKQQSLQEQIQKLQEQYKLNEEMQKKMQTNPELKRKMESLQKLMEELMDEETKKKFEEMEKLLQERNQDPENLKRMLEEMQKKDFNVEKELDRAMELFKQLKMEQKLEQTAKKLDSLANEQEKLSEESKKMDEEKKDMSKAEEQKKQEELQKKQEDIKKEFEKLKEDRKELKKMNEELDRPNDIGDQDQQEQNAEQEMEQSQKNMEQQKMDDASENQKNAADEMKDMAQDMQQSLQMMQKEQHTEDMKALRQILENLLTLSFDQEELMKEFKQVRQRDPRFVELGQQQLKLRDDARIIEDSLMALAKRVFEINSFVTREVTEMNNQMEGAIDGIKLRRKSMAAGRQQLAMTSINNLALLLNDVLKNMQQQAAQQMKGNQNCNKPGGKNSKPGKGKKPSMSQMQQSISQQIENLKKSGKQGKELSQELAKLAAQQEALRRAMKQMREEMEGQNGNQDGGKEGGGGQSLKEIEKQMEETEEDLVNKRLTDELIKRQRDIVTRLLESEKAQRERELDKKRESRTGKDLDRNLPPNFQKYLEAKEKQVELLKTISPALTPFYKTESNRYFKELSE